MVSRNGSWPLTYTECRERFLAVAGSVADHVESHPIPSPGPSGEELTIDIAVVGTTEARRGLLVMSGTHGIEGFAGSAIQVDLLHRWSAEPPSLDPGDAVVLVHGVNPWGMANWRRANEHNVDLNRNWALVGDGPLPANEPYAVVHDLLCPPLDARPDPEAFLAALADLVADRGAPWVRAAISGGQYDHPDGCYHGGRELQPSTTILAEAIPTLLGGTEEVLAIDLHTGHGRYGTRTILSRAPRGSSDDEWACRVFGSGVVEATVGNPEATSAPKQGQLAPGLVASLGAAIGRSFTLELGTRSETRMIAAEHVEHWLHRRGVRGPGALDGGAEPADADGVWEHRICSIPDDPEWERQAIEHGRVVLDAALDAVVGAGPPPVS